MPTFLIARNEMMCRALARRLASFHVPTPVCWHLPQWLEQGDGVTGRIGALAEVALLDCSGYEGDPFALLDRLQARLAPRRWLLLSDRPDASLILHAERLGASGCLAAPAPAELVGAALAMVWAGGECFPRIALSLEHDGQGTGIPPMFE